jgi:hypothetical protein
MARSTRDIWAKRVERWADSGLTAAEFAKETGINARTLAFWKWRLGRGTRRAAKPAAPAFVEVRAAHASDDALRAVVTADAEPIEVIIRDVVRIRVPQRFDAEALRRVIAAVEAR